MMSATLISENKQNVFLHFLLINAFATMAFPNRHSLPPSISDIRTKTNVHFGVHPCLWQAQVVLSILKRSGDVVSIAATGEGKTLTFWMPLLFSDGIQLVISPLNILLEQNVSDLGKLSVSAVGIYADTATNKIFKVGVLYNLGYATGTDFASRRSRRESTGLSLPILKIS